MPNGVYFHGTQYNDLVMIIQIFPLAKKPLLYTHFLQLVGKCVRAQLRQF